MKNIRFLTSDAMPGFRKYHVFFEHDGVKARLDWELSKELYPEDGSFDDLEAHVAKLMVDQLAFDIEDDVLMDEIREQNKTSEGSMLQEFLNNGYEEQDAEEFKRLAVERFGDG